MSTSKYKAVIFDFDDTLVESRAQKWAQHTHVAKKFYNLDLTEDKIREHWGKPLDILVGELYSHSDSLENMFKALGSTRGGYLKKIYPESLNTIETLLGNDVKVGILSAVTRDFLIEDLGSFGFPIERFAIIQSADETKVHKPDPDVFIPLLTQLKEEGIKGTEIVYVGDALRDLEAAHGAGIDFIGVTTGLYSEKDFKKAGAKVVIDNIKEIIKKVL